MNKASKTGHVSAKFLKEAADVLADPLSRITNFLVKLSVFPKSKIGKLKPLFKKGSKTDLFHFYPCVQNY